MSWDVDSQELREAWREVALQESGTKLHALAADRFGELLEAFIDQATKRQEALDRALQGTAVRDRERPTFVTVDTAFDAEITQLLPLGPGWVALFAEEGEVRHRPVPALALIVRRHPQHGLEQDVVALVPTETGEFEIANALEGYVMARLGPPRDDRDRESIIEAYERKRGTELFVSQERAQPFEE